MISDIKEKSNDMIMLIFIFNLISILNNKLYYLIVSILISSSNKYFILIFFKNYIKVNSLDY